MKHLRHQSRKKEVYESDFGDAWGSPGRLLAGKAARGEGKVGPATNLQGPAGARKLQVGSNWLKLPPSWLELA